MIENLHDVGIHTPVERIGWPDAFIEHAKPETLRELHGLTSEMAVAKASNISLEPESAFPRHALPCQHLPLKDDFRAKSMSSRHSPLSFPAQHLACGGDD